MAALGGNSGQYKITEINFRISLGKLVWTVRQIRYAVCLWPLSALFCISICSLTTLNFCISYRFVFSDGGQRYLVSHPLTDSNSFALQGWQLAPLASPSPSWASLTAVACGVEFTLLFKNWFPWRTLHGNQFSYLLGKSFPNDSISNPYTWYFRFCSCFGDRGYFFGVSFTFRITNNRLASCWSSEYK